MDVHQIDKIFDFAAVHRVNYISQKNVIDGFLSEVFNSSLLQGVNQLEIGAENREHVTLYVRKNPERFKIHLVDMGMQDIAERLSLTVDTIEDLQFCNHIASALPSKGTPEYFNFRSSNVIEIAKILLGDR